MITTIFLAFLFILYMMRKSGKAPKERFVVFRVKTDRVLSPEEIKNIDNMISKQIE
jgi:hypothetical protein